eukprot:scaffold4.g5024.t1
MGKKGGGGGGKQAADGGKSGGGGPLKGASQVKVRHILCEKLSKANEALSKIQAGEQFDQASWRRAVAREYSEDKARAGGDLGWKGKTDVVKEFADAAFALQARGGVGEYTRQPVKSQFGYHLILCEGRKRRGAPRCHAERNLLQDPARTASDVPHGRHDACGAVSAASEGGGSSSAAPLLEAAASGGGGSPEAAASGGGDGGTAARRGWGSGRWVAFGGSVAAVVLLTAFRRQIAPTIKFLVVQANALTDKGAALGSPAAAESAATLAALALTLYWSYSEMAVSSARAEEAEALGARLGARLAAVEARLARLEAAGCGDGGDGGERGRGGGAGGAGSGERP